MAATGLALATFSPRFRAPIRDQLVNQALAWGHVSEQAPLPRSRRAASLYLRIGELGGLSQAPMVPRPAALVVRVLQRTEIRMSAHPAVAGFGCFMQCSITSFAKSAARRAFFCGEGFGLSGCKHLT